MSVPEKIKLHAGPLSLVYSQGELRWLTLGRREVLRRVYAAVRDRNWGTVPAVISEVTLDAHLDRFQISYRAEHRQDVNQDAIEFVWHGQITGEADGTVTFAVRGTAKTGFWRNRLGCCVLHPIAECAGQPCNVTHTDGSLERTVFPDLIAPHQPFLSVRTLAHEVSPGLWAEVTFEGDVFETEDQRNWTDASFKTYSTPLAVPFPVWIEKGTVVAQSVTLRLRGPMPPFVPESDDGPVQITFPTLPPVPLPRLGVCVADHGQPLTALAAARLHTLQLDHLRVDLTLDDSSYPARLAQAASEAQRIGARILVALHLSPNWDAELTALRDLVTGASWPLGGWLIFSSEAKCTPAYALAQAWHYLHAAAQEAPFFGGTDAYFAELNRGRPVLSEADGVVYSINPQVHAFDDNSLLETPDAQAATVRSARRLYPDRAVWVSPVTLKPRFNPDATGPGKLDTVDRRQKLPLTAAWTVSSFKHLAEAGAAGVTYFETTGPLGLMEMDGAVFPAFQALAEIGSYAGGVALPTVSSRPAQVECLVLRRGQKTGVLLANMTADPQRAMVLGQSEGTTQTLPPYAVVVLDSQ